jgi:hypothetical protein
MGTLKGSTSKGQGMMQAQDAANAPFIAAGYWKEGMRLSCVVLSVHNSTNGKYIGVQLVNPPAIEIDGKRHTLVRIGSLAGIVLALKSVFAETKRKYFEKGDGVEFTCSGIRPPEQEGYSPMPEFDIEVTTPDEEETPQAVEEKPKSKKKAEAAA